VASVLKISNAAAMAMHAMVLLADSRERLMSTHEIATALDVSEAHLSKVLQRLTKAGLVAATRGPKGGFGLSAGVENASLLRVYEAIEGPLAADDCLLATSICHGENCVFGNLLVRINNEVREYLDKTKLIDATSVCRSIQ
jgi:Rrf2 family transcriptional regulator, nitric oxide-sensitive transcriptional repressor